MKINTASLNEREKLQIIFSTKQNLSLHSVVKISLNEKSYTFKIEYIHCDADRNLSYTANQFGYWGNSLSRNKEFDIRELIGVKVELASEDEAKNAKRASTYC